MFILIMVFGEFIGEFNSPLVSSCSMYEYLTITFEPMIILDSNFLYCNSLCNSSDEFEDEIDIITFSRALIFRLK